MKRIALVTMVVIGIGIFCFSLTSFALETDFYLGGGNYENVDNDAQGSFFWTKIRLRPLELGNIRLGLFAFLASGDGNDEEYQYDWEKKVIGLTAKITGLHRDFDLDLGIGRLDNNGSISLYESEQKDNIFLVSAHANFYQRRDNEEKWFPKAELNLEATLPYQEEQEHSWDNNLLPPEPYDNQSLELFFTQAVYDFELREDWRLTPGFNLGFIHQSGEEKPNFVQFGPMAVLSWHNQDIIQISFLNYRKNTGGEKDQWQWVNAWIDIIGLIRAGTS